MSSPGRGQTSDAIVCGCQMTESKRDGLCKEWIWLSASRGCDRQLLSRVGTTAFNVSEPGISRLYPGRFECLAHRWQPATKNTYRAEGSTGRALVLT